MRIRLAKLAACFAVCFAAAAAGSLYITPAMESGWYDALAKPSFTPPNWVFAPAWILLYALMAMSLYLISEVQSEEKTVAYAAFLAQLALNVAWSMVFFGIHNPDFALIIIIALEATLLAAIAFSRKASLPAAATAGRLARVTDNERGVWMDQGSQWFGLSGEVINCKEFGATGDGTTDDTTALRACIAAAQNGLQPKLVFIPAGSYVISDTLLPSPTTLRTVDITGAGIGTRIINRILGAAQTGTVTVTNGSATVTGSGTSFTADLIGATVRFGSDTEFYVVTGVASTTSLTLLAGGFSGTYRGATLAGVTMRWHKPVFAINDPTSSQTLANGSRIANMWIDNGRDSTHLINNTSNAIELTNAVDTYLDNLILTPFGHGISHRKTTIIFHANNVRIWPSGFVSSVTSANLSDKDGVQFESGGEDVTVYRNLFVTSGRSCVNSGTQGIGSTTQQVIFDAPLCQALYAPVAAELGTATAIGASSLTDTGQTWVVNKYRGALVSITSGTGQGQVRFISSNTATVLTLVTPWDTTTTPIATDGYQIGGGGFISGAAMAGVRIMSPYFEDTPGVGSGGNAWGEVAAYFGNGTSNVLVENTSNATGAYIFASDPALTDTFLNLMLGGQIDRLRIDTGGSRFTCLHARLLVQGGAGSNVVDNGTLSSFINCPRSGGASFTGFQKWGQPVVANNSDYRILDHNGTERPVLAFKGTALSVTTLQGGLTGSVADTATVTIGDKSNFLGAINVINANDEKGCLFFVSTGAVAELSDPDTTCSVTAATASSTNLYFSGSNLIIENRTGAVANYKISMLGG